MDIRILDFKEELDKIKVDYSYIQFNNHQIEQMCYRMYLCNNTCRISGKCEECGCLVTDAVVDLSPCKPNQPSIFRTEFEWNNFKNNITII